MDLKLKGKKALVCAASKGLGKAIALSLAEEGTDLFLCARSPEALQETAHLAQQAGASSVHWATGDLSTPAGRNALIEEVQKIWPGVDILIHNVGGPKPTTMGETALEDWEGAFQQLFMSIAHLNQVFLPYMQQQKWGRIVAITSLSVMEPIPGLALSNGLRPAIAGMLKTQADEVAKEGICINCIAPGI
ncbi:MAG: SDR family NAD(P)-dependent oxidoreductase, partial [Cyanobacteria bacterium]|nr:SDR family NAD(P)-dependent oxidoreductase [Cyanobacteriota bacterium]